MAYGKTQIGPDGRRHPISPPSEDEVYVAVEPEPEPTEPGQVEAEVEVEVELVEVEEPEAEVSESSKKDEHFPRHVGRGVYELRDGRRIKGKNEALEAQIEADEVANSDAE